MKDEHLNAGNEPEKRPEHRQSSLSPYEPSEADGAIAASEIEGVSAGSGENGPAAVNSDWNTSAEENLSGRDRSPFGSRFLSGRKSEERNEYGFRDTSYRRGAGDSHRSGKGFPWGPAFGIYICLMLAGALLSGHMARNRDAAPSQSGSQNAAQVEETADQNGASDGSQNGQGSTGAADADAEVEIGDTFYASDAERLNGENGNGQPVPTADPAAVSPRIEVESVSISADTTWMRQGERVQMSASITPENATDPALTWRTSNDSIAKISPSGAVTSVGGGNVVISATTSNGLVVEYPMEVSSTEKRMFLDVTRSNDYNDSVGNDWNYEYNVNEEQVSDHEEMIVVLGDTVTVRTEITEDDEDPDVGITEGSYTIDREGFENGFQMKQKVNVRENEGQNKGNEASFTVTYTFSNVGQ